MDYDEYRQRGKEMVDYIADYLEGIRKRRVYPSVKPGYMKSLLPDHAPEEGEDWDSIFRDVERVIMPGITHWQSPQMHAYFPALNSPPSLLGDMLADAIGCLGFTWASSPACTELETIVMDWLGKMLGLPDAFLHNPSSGSSGAREVRGGGVIQTTASESTFVALLAARTQVIRRVQEQYPEMEDGEINSLLVAYGSDQAHSSVEKAGLIGLVKMHFLTCDEELCLRGEELQKAIDSDRQEGFIPFFLCATLGTTGACAFDKLTELGPICEQEGLWMHIDAAYAGTAFVCPEYRCYTEGIEYADSFAFNPSKWMMVHFDCTALWLKNSGALHRTFNVQPLYLKHENSGAAIDYMHWQIPLSKRFRALKLWFVIRSFGITGLQKHVREGVRLAGMFEGLVKADPYFEVPAKRILGLVVFRLKGENHLTEALLKRLNTGGKVHMVPASLRGQYVIRFTVTSRFTTDADIAGDWNIIRSVAYEILQEQERLDETKLQLPAAAAAAAATLRPAKPQSDDEQRKREFGLSLLLSNSPLVPKFVNGSFAAIFENRDVIYEFVTQLSDSTFGRRSPSNRSRLRSSKQYSLDSRIDYLYDFHNRLKMAHPTGELQEIDEADDQNGGGGGDISGVMSSPRRPRSLSLGQEPADLNLHLTKEEGNSAEEGKSAEEAAKQPIPAVVVNNNDIYPRITKPLSNNTVVRCKHCGNVVD